MMINETFYRKTLLLLLHLVGWAVFVWVMFLENPELFGVMQETPAPIAGNFMLLAGYFYLNMYFLVPRLLSRKKIVAYIAVTLLFLALVCFVLPWTVRMFYFHDIPRNMPFPFPPENLDELPPWRKNFNPALRLHPHSMMQRLSIYTHFAQFLVVFIVSTGLRVISQWYREKQQLQELEKSKIQAELSFLKSQIHPHFLFNCLNTVYYLTLSRSDKAPETILSLSDFLRFVIIESESDIIPLEKETGMLEKYLHLQSLRASEKFELQFVREGDFREYSIMPLTFIPFVENAFKYGISAHTACFIHIRIEMDGGKLLFVCDNSVAPLTKQQAHSPGVGLDNIRKRLDLAYPDRHSLETGEDSAGFHVKLQIDLNEMYCH